MTSWRRRPPTPGGEGEVPISPEDLAWRIGASDERPEPALLPADAAPEIVDSDGVLAQAEVDAAAEAGGASPRIGPADASPSPAARPGSWRRRRELDAERRVAHAYPVTGATRRLVLWRDASAVLFVVIVIAFVAQLTLSNDGDPSTAVATLGTGGPTSTDVAVASNEASGLATLPPTVGPVVDPSLIPNIEATPTPVPTVRPAPTAGPSANPTPRPSTKPGPTPLPTVAPTSPPTAPPTAPPTPTPPPPVVASVSCGAPVVGLVTCTSNSANETPGSEVWTANEPFTVTGGGNGQASITMQFADGVGAVTITLSVSGPGGQSSDSTVVSV